MPKGVFMNTAMSGIRVLYQAVTTSPPGKAQHAHTLSVHVNNALISTAGYFL